MPIAQLLMLGVVALVGEGMRKYSDGAERSERERQQAFNKSLAEQKARGNAFKIPNGYAPQRELLGNIELKSGEKLVATFAFEPCEWWQTLGKKTSHPVPVGCVAGVGHVTSDRVLLIFDMEKVLGKKELGHWTSEALSFTAETVADALLPGLGKIVKAGGNIDKRTKNLMKKIAQVKSCKAGFMECPLFDDEPADWGYTSGGIIYEKFHGPEMYASPYIVFRPCHIADGVFEGDPEGFMRILNLKAATFEKRDEIEMPFWITGGFLGLDPRSRPLHG